MQITNCIWEIANLGKRTAELVVSDTDEFCRDEINKVNREFEYVVVKVPMNRPDLNFGLSALGFTLIETQINLSKHLKDFPFDDRLVRQIYSGAEQNI